MATVNEKPLIVVVGPTASGKTSTAIRIALKLDGEIICADSRTIYKDMDIGTAKPSVEEQSQVPHWGVDLVEPNDRFTAKDFQDYAEEKIKDIRKRGKMPMLVGGTGLYIDSVLFNFRFGDDNNSWRGVIKDNTYVVGIATNKEELRHRIAERTEQLFEDGVVEEATMLGKKYGWNLPSMTGNIYPLVKLHLDSQQTLEETKVKYTTLDWQLSKRQMTWLRPNPYIIWCSREEAYQYSCKVAGSV